MAAYYGQDLTDGALMLYVEDLSDLPMAEVVTALRDLRRDPKITRLPLPAAVRARIVSQMSPEGEAMLIASRMVELVSSLGPYRSAEVKLALGPVGWELVKMEGGWESVCRNLTYDNMGTLKAQWRNLARVLIERGQQGSEPLQLPDVSQPKLMDMSSILKRIPGGK
jgi:hypothetical protein